MRKNGLEHFNIEQVDTANSQEELNKKENDWIIKLDSIIGNCGYNIALYDDRFEIPDFIREKISKIALKRYYREFNVYKVLGKGHSKKDEFVGTWYNQKTCANDLSILASDISQVLSGSVSQSHGYTFEYTDDILKQRQLDKLESNKLSNNSHNLFNVYKSSGKGCSEKGRFVGTWYNQKDCAEFLNIESSTIPHCLVGNISQTQGYVFEYVDEVKKQIAHKNLTENKPIGKAFSVFGAICVQKAGPHREVTYNKSYFVGTWTNQRQCARDLNIDNRPICACLVGKAKQHKGYIFEYIE